MNGTYLEFKIYKEVCASGPLSTLSNGVWTDGAEGNAVTARNDLERALLRLRWSLFGPFVHHVKQSASPSCCCTLVINFSHHGSQR